MYSKVAFSLLPPNVFVWLVTPNPPSVIAVVRRGFVKTSCGKLSWRRASTLCFSLLPGWWVSIFANFATCVFFFFDLVDCLEIQLTSVWSWISWTRWINLWTHSLTVARCETRVEAGPLVIWACCSRHTAGACFSLKCFTTSAAKSSRLHSSNNCRNHLYLFYITNLHDTLPWR